MSQANYYVLRRNSLLVPNLVSRRTAKYRNAAPIVRLFLCSFAIPYSPTWWYGVMTAANARGGVCQDGSVEDKRSTGRVALQVHK